MNDSTNFASSSLIDRVAERISKWHPKSQDNNQLAETELNLLLSEFLSNEKDHPDAVIVREASVSVGAHAPRVDFLLGFTSNGQKMNIVIELVLLRNRESFFRQLERVLSLRLPAILVVVGKSKQLRGLLGDINRLAQLNAQIRVVSVSAD